MLIRLHGCEGSSAFFFFCEKRKISSYDSTHKPRDEKMFLSFVTNMGADLPVHPV